MSTLPLGVEGEMVPMFLAQSSCPLGDHSCLAAPWGWCGPHEPGPGGGEVAAGAGPEQLEEGLSVMGRVGLDHRTRGLDIHVDDAWLVLCGIQGKEYASL